MLISNGIVVTLGEKNKIIHNGAVLVEGEKIKAIGKAADLKKKYPKAKLINAQNKLVMPGFINTHMHLYSTFARGLGKAAPSKNFPEILKNLWWRLDKKLNMQDVYYSAILPLIDCIKHGTTTIIDHHASPNAITGSLETIAKACKKAGIRANLCYETSDRDGAKIADEGIEENANFIKKCDAEKNPMISGLFGLHASMTISAKTLSKCLKYVEELNSGFHVHTAEDISDVQDSKKKYKCGVIERWYKNGVLKEKTILPHCIHISTKEMDLLAKTGTNAIHNPQSNMNNAVGVANILEMLKRKVLVGMGTDGMTSRMQEEVRTAYLLHRINLRNPQVAFCEAPQLLLNNNAKIANKFFYGVKVGELSVGAAADIILIDYIPFTPFDENTFLGHFLFGIFEATVDTTICNGKILMQNKKLTTLNEAQLCAEALELSKKFWARF